MKMFNQHIPWQLFLQKKKNCQLFEGQHSSLFEQTVWPNLEVGNFNKFVLIFLLNTAISLTLSQLVGFHKVKERFNYIKDSYFILELMRNPKYFLPPHSPSTPYYCTRTYTYIPTVSTLYFLNFNFILKFSKRIIRCTSISFSGRSYFEPFLKSTYEGIYAFHFH